VTIPRAMTLPHRGLSAYSASVREFGAGNQRSPQIWEMSQWNTAQIRH
jgi:hypothetical protein